MKNKVSAIIPYSTTDFKFLKTCIDSIETFCEEIIVVYSDHFYDGEKENFDLIKRSILENPKANFICQEWHSGKHPQYWINKAKIKGFDSLKKETNYILLLDTDEIVETKKMIYFLNHLDEKYNSYCFSTYWYFREPCYQALQTENLPVMVKKEKFKYDPDFIHADRQQCKIEPCLEGVKNNSLPFIHHYSWVRNKKEMLRKTSSWGHKHDKDWQKLIEEEFSREFNGKDFVHNYDYKIVKPYINIPMHISSFKDLKII